MKSTRILSLLLCLLLTAAILSGCTGGVPAEDKDPAIRVTDMKGRELTLDKPAERIVALTAADCEIVYAIGAQELLVGRGEYCDYPAEVLDIPSVQSGAQTDIEQIIALRPQVVLMATMTQTVEQVQQLESAGICVAVSEAQDIDGVYESIALIGALTGHDAEAAAVIDGMKSAFDGVRARALPEGKTVYFEVSPLEYGLWTAGSDTFMNEIAEMLGLENCFADVQGWCEVSEEQVIARDPDYIVTISMYFGEGPTPVEEIASRPGWSEMTAVRNGGVFQVGSDELSRPAPRLTDGAEALCDLIYGK